MKNPNGCDTAACECDCGEDSLVPMGGDVWQCCACMHVAANDPLRDLLRKAAADPMSALRTVCEDIAAGVLLGGESTLSEAEEGTLRALCRLVLERHI